MRAKPAAGLPNMLLLLVFLTGMTMPLAKAGTFCAGERDRVLNFIQRTEYLVEQEVSRVLVRSARQIGRAVVQRIGPRLALWVLYVQARQVFIDALARSEAIDKPLAALNPISAKVRQVATLLYGEAPPGSDERWGEFTPGVDWAVRTFFVCQGIRNASPKPCRLLAPLGEQVETQCRNWIEKADWRDRCRPPAAYWVLERLVYEIGRTCESASAQGNRLCSLINNPQSHRRQVCESLAQGSDKPCRAQFEEGVYRRTCLDDLAITELYQGRIGDAEFVRRTKASAVMDAVRWARYEGRDCLVLALRQFDRLAPAVFAIGDGQ